MSSRRAARAARRRERGTASPDEDADDGDAGEGAPNSGEQDEPSEEPEDVAATPRRRSLRERFGGSRSRNESTGSTCSARSGASMQSSASCKAARQIPDHQPTASARFAAGFRAFFFSSNDGYFLSRYQVASSTTLQMLLYFNLLYAIVFGVLYQLLAAWKSSIWQAPLVVELVTPMSFWVWAFIEMLRLGLGYFGNLAERVPWLMGFWMLTLFPQPVIQMWFMLVQGLAGWFVLPIEVWLSVGMQVIYLAELVVSYRANKRLVAKAAADFHLQPIDPAYDSADAL